MPLYRIAVAVLAALLLAAPVRAAETQPASSQTYSKQEIGKEMEGFFDESSKTIAEFIERAFKDHGQPNAFIKGEEAGGAFIAGLRYGQGELHMKAGGSRPVYWQGPSIGLDLGASASKVFTLVYDLPNHDAIYQRFPGVEGGAYILGGLSVHTLKSGEVVLTLARTGVGLRLGANVGYIHFTRQKEANPF